MVSEIQTMRKLNNPITTSFAGPFLYPIFFLYETFIFVTMIIAHKFGDLNFSIHPV